MDMPPAAATQVVDRKLDELCACLADALSSSRQRRSPYAEERLRDAIASKTVFLRSLLAAEAECHGGARPEHLADAEARFAVLVDTFHQWARRAVVAAAPEPVEVEEVEESDCSGSTCSCTGSCQEAATEGDAKRDVVVEARDTEGASDGIAEDNDVEEGEHATDTVAKKREAVGTREEATMDAVVAKERDNDREAAAETGKRAVQRRWWWQRSSAWCGAAGVVAVVVVGLAVELAAVAHHNVNVYVVPT